MKISIGELRSLVNEVMKTMHKKSNTVCEGYKEEKSNKWNEWKSNDWVKLKNGTVGQIVSFVSMYDENNENPSVIAVVKQRGANVKMKAEKMLDGAVMASKEEVQSAQDSDKKETAKMAKSIDTSKERT